jgi:hypothetical protein
VRLDDGSDGSSLVEAVDLAVRLVPDGRIVRLGVVGAAVDPNLSLDPTTLLVVDQDVTRTDRSRPASARCTRGGRPALRPRSARPPSGGARTR